MPSCILVKQRGTSLLRSAMGTELDFQRVLLKAESDPDDTGVRLDNLDGCLWLAYKTLVWMDDERARRVTEERKG